MASLEEQVSKLEADKESLKTKLKMAIQKGKSIESDKKRLQAEILEVQQQVQRYGELEKEVETLREGKAQAQQENEQLRQENTRLKEELQKPGDKTETVVLENSKNIDAVPAKTSADAQEALKELRALTERVKKAAELAASIAAPKSG